jgi:hypothetical protein
MSPLLTRVLPLRADAARGATGIFLLLAATVFLTTQPAAAQAGISKSLTVAGTTAKVGGDTYSWIALQPTDPALLSGKQIAIYRKSGNAASANPYSRVAVIQPEGDVHTIGSLMARAGSLGEDLVELRAVLSELLQEAAPATAISAPQLMSSLICNAVGHDDKMKRVMLLARQRPAVALCAGLAHTEKITGLGMVTYELRDFDKAKLSDVGVLGRLTLDPFAPLVLPAPGAPVELPDTSAKGNLNATLRWATPNNLRDLAPLHYGFDVYRVTKAATLAHGWHSAPPASTALLAAEPAAKKINTLAILTPVTLTAAEAADLTNKTIYLDDDNNRFRSAGVPFTDNDQFYYFVVARDLLGHGGAPSPGTLVTLCDRLPTNAPRKVQVRNLASYTGTTHAQHFIIEWQAPALEAGEAISAYYVYRWRTPNEIPGKCTHLDPVFGKPDHNLIAVLPATQLSFIDDGSSSPPAWAEIDYGVPTWPASNGKTYFYTVRAADASVSANISGNSPPVWGVLRDRQGPAGATGDILINCSRPGLTYAATTQIAASGLPADQVHLALVCFSPLAKGLAWAEWKYLADGHEVLLGRATFTGGASRTLLAQLRKTLADFSSKGTIYCRVSTTGGKVSAWVPVSGQDRITPVADHLLELKWTATLSNSLQTGADCGWRDQAIDPTTGLSTDLSGVFTPSAGSREWKIYRRVNNSEQTLMAQGEIAIGSIAPVTWTDTAPPASYCTLCYYLQLYDEHGNPSPMTQQGECLEHYDASFLPTPMLEPITHVTPFLAGKMHVSWFCNTTGVERFEVWVGRASGTAPASTGSGYSLDQATSHPNTVAGIEGCEGLDFAVFQSSIARHLSIGGTPQFSVDLPVATSDTYSVLIRAVGPGTYGSRTMGAFSNLENYRYSLPSISLPAQVPWPQRPLPAQASFHSGISATHLNLSKLSPWKGNAVRIGEYADPATDATATVSKVDQGQGGALRTVTIAFNISTQRDPEQYLYTNDAVHAAEPNETLPGGILPAALYRVQIANANFASVSGDIVQVSPLMERIAQFDNGLNTKVTDPFIAILHRTDSPLAASASNFDHDIFLLDRQPVLKGATYKYLLVRFNPSKEIERVIVTNTVDVPL